MPTLQLAIDARKGKAGADAFTKATKQVTDGAKKADTSLHGMQNQLNATGKSASGLKNMFGSLFATFTAGMAIRGIVSTITEFGDSIAMLGAVAGATQSEFKALADEARNLGAASKFTAGEAATAMTALARMGLNTNAVLDSTVHILNLATGQMMSLEESAQIAAVSMRQFNLQASDAERIVDVLTYTSNNAGTDVRQLGEALKYAGTVANQAGISFEETNAALGLISDGGIRGSAAGTGLKTVLASLLDTTPKFTATLKRLGIAYDDVNPEKHNLIEIFKRFKDANLETSDAFKLFGLRGAAVALILSNSSEKLEDFTNKNREAGGAAAAMAEIMSNTLGFSFKELVSSAQELSLVIGESGFGGALKTVIKTLSSTIRLLAGMESETGKASQASKLLATTLKIVAGVMALMVVIKIADFFLNLAKTITTAAAALRNFTIASGGAIASIGVLAAALAGVQVGTYLNDEFKIVSLTMQAAIDSFNNYVIHLEAGAKIAGTSIKHWFGIGFNFIKNSFAGVMWAFGDFINFIDGGWSTLVAALKTAWSSFVFAMGSGFNDVIGKVAGIFNTIIKGVQKALREMVYQANLIGAISESTALSLESRIGEMGRATRAAVKGLQSDLKNAKLQTFTGDEGSVGNGIIETAKAISGEVQKELTLQEKINGIITARDTALKDQATTYQSIQDDIEKGFNGADRKGQGFWDNALGNIEGVTETASTAIDDFFAQNEKLQKGLADTATAADKVSDSIGANAEETKNLARVDTEALESLARAHDAISEMSDSIGNNLTGALTDVVTGAKSAKDAFKDFAKSVIEQMIQIAIQKFIVSQITSGLNAMGGAGVDYLGGVNSGGGSPTGYAKGGVVTGSTLFPTKSGLSEMGESGPEAIMPLSRDSQGRLGVSGGGSTVQNKSVNINMNIQTPDANSFRRSERQDTNRLKKIARGF